MPKIKVALVGNPNAGKTTLFNAITGLNQKTGNYSGVTVAKSSGNYLQNEVDFEIIDFPGTYSIYPTSNDEYVLSHVLHNPKNQDFPDKIIVVIDAHNLKRGLLLFDQVRELGVDTYLVLNFFQEAQKKGIQINMAYLEKHFNCSVCIVDALRKKGITELFELIQLESKSNLHSYKIPRDKEKLVSIIKEKFQLKNHYAAWTYLAQTNPQSLTSEEKNQLNEIKKDHRIISKRLQVKETIDRYALIEKKLQDILVFNPEASKDNFTEQFDKVATHPIWGYFLFVSILLAIFQLIYTWASVPMDFIDALFSQISLGIRQVLPSSLVRDLIVDGILPGISGVMIFIPQIAILFTFLYFLEESGYMSRVIYLLDRWLRPFGMSGKSVLPLTLGIACAVPAIMSTRSIQNNKDRLITILVTPFITCSARLPVYTILISIVIPDTSIYGFHLQGLVFLFMYLLGILSALSLGFLLQLFLKSNYQNYLALEMPDFRLPSIKGVFLLVWLKVGEFVKEAGKIILAISILIWVLANYSPTTNKTEISQQIKAEYAQLDSDQKENKTQSILLEKSYLGILGKSIEPLIQPLGYDWKIGIGLISSFVAREVFVGTMASIYSIGSTETNSNSLKEVMKNEMNPKTKKPMYNLASGLSLLVFYAFSMQCISTLAVVRKETKTWRWPIIQFLFMTGFAYISSLIVYSLLK